MATPALLIDADPSSDGLVQALRRAAPELELDVQHVLDVEAVVEDLTQRGQAGASPLLILLGPHLKNPVASARRMHRASPLSYLVFMTDPDHAAELRCSLSSVAMIGAEWRVTGLGADDLGDALRGAAQSTQQRRHLRITHERINAQLMLRRASGAEASRQTISDRFLASVLEHAYDAIIATDTAGVITTWNRAAGRLFGLSEREALGQSIETVALGEWGDQVPHLIEDLLAWRVSQGARELRCRRVDKTIIEVELVLTPVHDESGLPIGISAIVRDITARKRGEQALLQSEQRVRLIVDSALDAVVTINAHGNVTGWNPQAQAIFEWRRDEAIGRPLADLVIPEHSRDAHRAGLQRFLATGEGRVLNKRLELTALRKGGEEFPIELTIAPLELSDYYEFSAFIRDITERKRLEDALKRLTQELEHRVEERTAQLARSNEALERSNLELTRFAYVASHDLQSPLRSISGFAQLIKQDYQGRLGAEADVWISRVVENTNRMQTLIADLLSYSRVDSAAHPLRPTDFRAVFKDAVASLDAAIVDSGAQVTCGELPTVLGDTSQLVQLLQNLIDNAVKYHGTDPPRVHVEARAQGDEWLFSVRDNGIGIEPKHTERIFEVFQRLHTHQAYPGTGIGLAVCRRVVHRHGGRIWVDSQPGHGSVFYFTIPVPRETTI
ncbi:MAG: sensor histidine kinase [Nitrospirota bacterium]